MIHMTTTEIPFDPDETVRQIGMINLAATSGGRVLRVASAFHGLVDLLVLPVAHGYSVEVALDASDTYNVRRVFTRGGVRTVKDELTNVYCDQIGDAVYAAGCYHHPINEVFHG